MNNHRQNNTIKQQSLQTKKIGEKTSKGYEKLTGNAEKTVPKYKTIDIVEKQDLLKKMAQQYKTMDSDKKQQLLNKKALEYKTMDAAKKQEVLERHNKNIVFVRMKPQICVLKS